MTMIYFELVGECAKHKDFILTDTPTELCAIHGEFEVENSEWKAYYDARKEWDTYQTLAKRRAQDAIQKFYQKRREEMSGAGEQHCPGCKRQMQHLRARDYYCAPCQKRVSVHT